MPWYGPIYREGTKWAECQDPGRSGPGNTVSIASVAPTVHRVEKTRSQQIGRSDNVEKVITEYQYTGPWAHVHVVVPLARYAVMVSRDDRPKPKT